MSCDRLVEGKTILSIERFGVPVSVVTAEQAERTLSPGAGAG